MDQDDQDIRSKFEKISKGQLLDFKFLPAQATALERECYELCQDICRVYNEQKRSVSAMALAMGCTVERANQAIHSHYQAFQKDELQKMLERLMASL